MKRLMVCLVSGLMGAAFAATNPVDTNEWIGDPTTHNGAWDVADNWSLKRVPIASDHVILKFYSDRPNYTVTINGSQQCSQLSIEDKTTPGTHTTTFDGTGTLTLQCSKSYAHDFGKRGCVVIDGPKIDSHNGAPVYLHAQLTMKGGELNIAQDGGSAVLFFWNDSASLLVDGGTVVTRWIRYRTTDAAGGWVTVDSGTLDVVQVEPYQNYASTMALTVNGGICSVGTLSLKRTGDKLVQTGGVLQIGKTDFLNDPEISLTGGHFRCAFQETDPCYRDPRFICPPGVEVEYPGNYVFSDNYELKGEDPFLVHTLMAGATPAYVSRKTIVFTNQFAFRYQSGSQRNLHLYGPMTFRTRADMPESTANCWAYAYGNLTIDTRDWADETVTRNMYFRGLASGDGTLELNLVGGGTVSIAPVYTYTSYKSTVVGEGTTLALVDRDSVQ